jgi:hypothetical protein|nr:MAG TPA: hypothetical protein [Bacteriophage sp.]
MSRPFSYNDENFTIIGNVLFVHFKYEEEADAGTRLCEIPTKIFDRLLFYSSNATTCYNILGGSGGNFQINIIKYNNKFYLSNITPIQKFENRYIFSILC